MTEKRFTIIQDGDNFSVMDNLKNRYMGMFEFKEDEFPTFFCFQQIIDLLNELNDENEQLEKENKELKDKNSQLQETLAFRSNQLALMEQLIDDLGSEEMERQMEEILND